MSRRNNVQAVRLPRRGHRQAARPPVPEAAARQRLEPGHGTWYYQIELPPRADGTRRPPLRHGGFATETDAKAELDLARELLAIAAPGDPRHGHPDRRRHHRRHARDPHAPRPRPGPQAGRRRPTTPPSARPPWASGWRSGWPRKKKLRPGTVRSYSRPHPPVPQAAPRAHPRSTGSGSPTSPRCSTTSRSSTTPSPRPAPAAARQRRAAVKGRRRVGPATCQRIRATLRSALSTYMQQHPGALPANVASLVELPPGTRPKALVWTDERVRAWQKDFDAAARRRPRGRRAGQPGRHLDLHPAPVAGHGLDPRPDHGLPRGRPPAPAARPVAADRHPGAAPRRGLRAAPPRHRPAARRCPRSAGRSPSSAGTPSRAPPSPTPASAPSPSTPTPSPTSPPGGRSRTRRRKPPGTPGPDSGFEFTDELRQPAAPRHGHRRLPHDRLPRRAAARSGCTTCATAPPPCCWPPGTT